MEVKIYREPENVSLLLDEDQLSEYNRLISELGISNRPVVETKVPSVYVPINIVQQRTLKAICGVSVDYKKYKRSSIPVEVLQCIKIAEDNKMFDKICIWYDEKELDPIAVGLSYQSEDDRVKDYSWRMDHSLIARWGDCAMELPDLLKMGFERAKLALSDKATDLKIKVDAFLQNQDVLTRKFFEDGQANFEKS